MLKKTSTILLIFTTTACASLPKSKLLGMSIGLGLGVIIGKVALNLNPKPRLYKVPISHRHRSPNYKAKIVCLPHRGPEILRGYGRPLCPSKDIFNFGFILGPLIGYYLSPKVYYYLKKRAQKEFLIDLKENMIELPQRFNEDFSFFPIPTIKKKKILLRKKIKDKKNNLTPKDNNWNGLNLDSL